MLFFVEKKYLTFEDIIGIPDVIFCHQSNTQNWVLPLPTVLSSFKLTWDEDKSTLLACMLISFSIWLVTTLSENYTTEIAVAVRYKNLPENQVPVVPLQDELYLYVEGKGSELVKGLGLRQKSVTIDYQKYVKTPLIATERVKKDIEEQLNLTIEQINPDTMYFKLDQEVTRRVPLVFKQNIQAARQFEIIRASLKLSPDSVTIVGPAIIVDTIQQWRTRNFAKENVRQTLAGNIDLLVPEHPAVKISAKKAAYRVEVEEYTEKKVEVPIMFASKPSGLDIMVYPERINITFQVALSDFKRVNKDSFELLANFANVDLDKDREVPLTLSKKPLYIRSIRMEQERAEFIIIE